jgi:hypothetical protein
MSRSRTITASAWGVALALSVAGCGGDPAPSAQVPAEPSAAHVHGLGVDPADESLFIATHSGLWRAPADSQKASPVGKSRQDVMGFTVVGPNRFLGSGHPDLTQDLPPLLGLISSTNGGRSWKPVSLLGEADFHVLRYRPGRIYGYDATNGRLMASADDGGSWRELSPPGSVLDLAIDPEDVEGLVVTTEDGLHRSTDGGNTWRPLGSDVGLLAWPAQDALFLADGEGRVHRSGDGGRTLKAVGRAGGQPAAFGLTPHRAAAGAGRFDGQALDRRRQDVAGARHAVVREPRRALHGRRRSAGELSARASAGVHDDGDADHADERAEQVSAIGTEALERDAPQQEPTMNTPP